MYAPRPLPALQKSAPRAVTHNPEKSCKKVGSEKGPLDHSPKEQTNNVVWFGSTANDE